MRKYNAKRKAIKKWKKGTKLELTDNVVQAFHTGFNMGWIARKKKSPKNHAPYEVRGTDEPFEGQAMGFEGHEKGES